ncbi:MAG: transcriptional regulator [Paraprevotella sp.]|nr:transcriptional regulator [Paraprevotella sp.]MBR2380018.1 transcriptional regulator [Paraprevotella sp.]
MELGIFERQLRLMVLLTQNREYTIDELCRKLDMSRRTIYRYLELFRDIGFEVIKQGNVYRLDKSSPFFKEITQLVHFTEDEALTLRYVLDTLSDTDIQVRHLRQKLERIYDFGILSAIESDKERADNLKNLYEAIKQHRQVILHDYSSANSNRTDDRAVEPYAFLNNHNEIRCYELRTGLNKTFKVSRIGKVEILDLLWINETKHTQVYTDLFQFSGEEKHRIVLRLGRLAYNLLKEEYPKAVRHIETDGPDHWLLTVDVCSFQGVGRFVLGLYEDIEVVESDTFKAFLQEKLSLLTKKVSSVS